MPESCGVCSVSPSAHPSLRLGPAQPAPGTSGLGKLGLTETADSGSGVQGPRQIPIPFWASLKRQWAELLGPLDSACGPEWDRQTELGTEIP